MDEINAQPQVIYTASTPWYKNKLLLLAFIVGIISLIAFLFIKFNKLNQKPNAPFLGKLKFACPVARDLCKQGKVSSLNNQPAISYNLPSATKVTTPDAVIDSLQFKASPYRPEDPIGLYQSFISGNDCYAFTYTISSDSTIEKIDLLPLAKGSTIITTGTKQDNLIIQLQKRPMEPSLTQPDFKRCSVVNLKPKDFGQYVEIDTNIFY